MSYRNEGAITVFGGIGFLDLLTVLFIGLKLGGVINWSWWWVTAPLWGQVVLCAMIAVIVILAWLIKNVIFRMRKRHND